jgi:polyhydroxyalkanoate synthesis regulator phasin
MSTKKISLLLCTLVFSILCPKDSPLKKEHSDLYILPLLNFFEKDLKPEECQKIISIGVNEIKEGVTSGKLSKEDCKKFFNDLDLKEAYSESDKDFTFTKKGSFDKYCKFFMASGCFGPSSQLFQEAIKEPLYGISTNFSDEKMRNTLYDFYYYHFSSFFPAVYTEKNKKDFYPEVKKAVNQMFNFSEDGQLGSKSGEEIVFWMGKIQDHFSQDDFVKEISSGSAFYKQVQTDPLEALKRFVAASKLNASEMVQTAEEARARLFGFALHEKKNEEGKQAEVSVAQFKELSSKIDELRQNVKDLEEQSEKNQGASKKSDSVLASLKQKLDDVERSLAGISGIDEEALKKVQQEIEQIKKWKAMIFFCTVTVSAFVLYKGYELYKKFFGSDDE